MVTLEEITAANFEDFMEMELPEHQRGYLASNAYSIAQARYYDDYIPRGICYKPDNANAQAFTAASASKKPASTKSAK